MAAKIRLARHGKKGHPFYHIVVADSRAPRDGKFIEKLGTYDPNTNPATVELNFDKALDWLNKGAQPTETTRAILSYKGVMLKKHLEGGVKKGALTPEAAEQKFQAWVSEKEGKISAKTSSLAQAKAEDGKKRMSAETKVKEAKAEVLRQKRAEQSAKLEEAAKAAAAEAAEAAAPAPTAAEEAAAEVAEAAAEAPAAE
ncbi:MAG: 30S ribosomal protein S16 [Prevotellaceae bacterium]|nr:30S ribosomal protein S16 [Prevotellaceae bacterium]